GPRRARRVERQGQEYSHAALRNGRPGPLVGAGLRSRRLGDTGTVRRAPRRDRPGQAAGALPRSGRPTSENTRSAGWAGVASGGIGAGNAALRGAAGGGLRALPCPGGVGAAGPAAQQPLVEQADAAAQDSGRAVAVTQHGDVDAVVAAFGADDDGQVGPAPLRVLAGRPAGAFLFHGG